MADYLPPTIDSVLAQNYPNLEYLVMDGGSTDGTLDILKRYGDRLHHQSGPDGGPADAIHKGLEQASGEILAWLNADDVYLPGAIRTAVDFLNAHPDVDVLYGEGNWIDSDGAVIERYPTLPYDAKALETECFICQPAAFFRASAYRRCPMDPAQDLSFDYDLWIRMAQQGMRFAHIPQYLAGSRMHAGAKTLGARKAVIHSCIHLLQRHYGYVPHTWVLTYTVFQMDGRDQFFAPFQSSKWKYLASLPFGLRCNRAHPFRYLSEWISAGKQSLARRMQK
jgi:glycosyltransferase involved in cell wall biosynthesis